MPQNWKLGVDRKTAFFVRSALLLISPLPPDEGVSASASMFIFSDPGLANRAKFQPEEIHRRSLALLNGPV